MGELFKEALLRMLDKYSFDHIWKNTKNRKEKKRVLDDKRVAEEMVKNYKDVNAIEILNKLSSIEVVKTAVFFMAVINSGGRKNGKR